jgi:hypothetical protein
MSLDVPACHRKGAGRSGFLARLAAAIDAYAAARGRTLVLSRDLHRAQREMHRVARLAGQPLAPVVARPHRPKADDASAGLLLAVAPPNEPTSRSDILRLHEDGHHLA